MFGEHLEANDPDQAQGRLDVVVNDAGITGGFRAPREAAGADLLGVYDANVFGVVPTTQAMLVLLERPDAPVIVNSAAVGARLPSPLIPMAWNRR